MTILWSVNGFEVLTAKHGISDGLPQPSRPGEGGHLRVLLRQTMSASRFSQTDSSVMALSLSASPEYPNWFSPHLRHTISMVGREVATRSSFHDSKVFGIGSGGLAAQALVTRL